MLTIIILFEIFARFVKHTITLVWGYFCLAVLVTALKDLVLRLLRVAGPAEPPINNGLPPAPPNPPARHNRRRNVNRVKAIKKETVVTTTELILEY